MQQFPSMCIATESSVETTTTGTLVNATTTETLNAVADDLAYGARSGANYTDGDTISSETDIVIEIVVSSIVIMLFMAVLLNLVIVMVMNVGRRVKKKRATTVSRRYRKKNKSEEEEEEAEVEMEPNMAYKKKVQFSGSNVIHDVTYYAASDDQLEKLIGHHYYNAAGLDDTDSGYCNSVPSFNEGHHGNRMILKISKSTFPGKMTSRQVSGTGQDIATDSEGYVILPFQVNKKK